MDCSNFLGKIRDLYRTIVFYDGFLLVCCVSNWLSEDDIFCNSKCRYERIAGPTFPSPLLCRIMMNNPVLGPSFERRGNYYFSAAVVGSHVVSCLNPILLANEQIINGNVHINF